MVATRVAYLARRAAEFGVHCAPVTVDMTQVRRRSRPSSMTSAREVNGDWRRPTISNRVRRRPLHGTQGRRGHPKGRRHADPTADTIFINTAAARRSGIAGLDSVSLLDSTSIMELDVLPEHLLVLGVATSA